MKEFLIQRYRPDPSGPVIRPTLVRVDDDGRIIQTDRHAEAMFGFTSGDLAGQPVQSVLASRQDDPFAPAHRHHLDHGQTVLVTFRHKDGFFFAANLGLSTEMRDSDRAAHATIALKDTTDMDHRLLKLAERGAGFGLWELDIASNEISWSEGMYRLLQLHPGSELSPEQALFYCQTGQHRVRALFRRCLRTGQPFRLELSVSTGQQRLQRVTLAGQALNNGDRVQTLGGVMINDSEAMRHDHARRQAQRILEATASATPDLVVAVDTKLDLLHFNAPWANQFRSAFSLEPSPGDNLKTLLNDFPDERRLIERLWQRAFAREHFVAEMPLNRQGQGLPVYEFRFQRIRGSQGEVLGAVHVARDISNRAPGNNSDHRLEPLQQALDNGTLILEFQYLKPVASATWGDHIEILCRIPGAGECDAALTPDQFLPVAERSDLARRLDRQVIRQTLDWLGRCRILEPRLKYCGFNLSLATLLDDSFADFMEQVLTHSPFKAHCFCLEIRASHASQYPDEVAVLCDALHRVGCRVALEGAGASVESYSLAANLPVDIIKLDRRIMNDLASDPVQQIMVQTLHRIAEAAGKETVATFIESDETLRKVRTLGIHFGQGYRLSRPRPLAELQPAAVNPGTGRMGDHG
ncbi:MAG: EAL domain-containing protein [Marinobacter sp.]